MSRPPQPPQQQAQAAKAARQLLRAPALRFSKPTRRRASYAPGAPATTCSPPCTAICLRRRPSLRVLVAQACDGRGRARSGTSGLLGMSSSLRNTTRRRPRSTVGLREYAVSCGEPRAPQRTPGRRRSALRDGAAAVACSRTHLELPRYPQDGEHLRNVLENRVGAGERCGHLAPLRHRFGLEIHGVQDEPPVAVQRVRQALRLLREAHHGGSAPQPASALRLARQACRNSTASCARGRKRLGRAVPGDTLYRQHFSRTAR